ncbi:MAG: undecaprenyl-diphosphate phosphatase [Phycisphaeraceae bacterium]|nr:undecaprenyl-diphosphate phosphatase [Phycisphaeraceae bacterium]
METWQAIVLGLVEGITEYLPISSTGHLIIAGDLMKLDRPETKAAFDAFSVIVQGGAILAVLLLYLPRFVQMLMGLLGRDRAGLRIFVNIVVAFIPAAVVGVILKKTIEAWLFHLWPVVFALVFGGIYMIGVELWRRSRKPMQGGVEGKAIENMKTGDALFVGLLQIFSMWPGTSRSMMTITAGYFRGLKPGAAAEFSFLLGMPTLLAATLYTLYKDHAEHKAAGTKNMFEVLGAKPILIGIAVAAISAFIAVRWLVGFLNKHGLVAFGIYRIIVGVLLLALALAGIVTVAK